ncbi:hypothetical protein VNO77_44035 [Canavalia gladiata]|uniref:Uncharacterized protein n=1 Tax=Canavalia gladiata TaxID=3824 RepID=A0AAN9JVA8_CANGL
MSELSTKRIWQIEPSSAKLTRPLGYYLKYFVPLIRLRKLRKFILRLSRQRVASGDHMLGHDKDENLISVRLPTTKPCWRHSVRHIVMTSLSSFLYGYHTGVANETLESISIDLNFSGNIMAEGLVVSICLEGALVSAHRRDCRLWCAAFNELSPVSILTSLDKPTILPLKQSLKKNL